MYIEVTDAIAITIALTTSITLIVTTAVRNAQLMRRLRELSEKQ
jgi:predicted transcriptional regulator